jgi:ribosome-associated heat shock protein Hsp15
MRSARSPDFFPPRPKVRMADTTIRLDQFLCFARFAKTRSIAQALVGQGHIRIDGRPVCKSSAQVRVGSVLGVPVGGHVRVVRVEALPMRRGPAPEARTCYTDLV